MKFFVPGAENNQKAVEVYDGIKKFVKKTISGDITDRKIYHVSFTHDGKPYEARIGEEGPYASEPVIAILETSGIFLICTPNRGVLHGEPILVGKNDMIHVTDFES
ncbi:MAG: hypothetical protein KAV00_13510 [Phycisphaerae bacterium]|nr:hypothetical protein [Phycisphaerae bacterium]